MEPCRHPWQGGFVVEALTDIVEEAAHEEFEALSEPTAACPWSE
jgi:methylmalonyl-CoA mutase N-terminal domain/subunit